MVSQPPPGHPYPGAMHPAIYSVAGKITIKAALKNATGVENILYFKVTLEFFFDLENILNIPLELDDSSCYILLFLIIFFFSSNNYNNL